MLIARDKSQKDYVSSRRKKIQLNRNHYCVQFIFDPEIQAEENKEQYANKNVCNKTAKLFILFFK